ncbi:MAG: 4-(cytidine 5'-diphospho)-2-C-methyl-D-erythritol kinase [Planctomycetota bacterium]|jgi:4-diphosphocytidyl-2-C-methyl-D-erythritol kinase
MKEQFSEFDGKLLVRAPAKINLSLLISGKRADGFHEIETVMAKIDLYDELLFEPGRLGQIELVCRGAHWAPEGEENLVYRACKMLYDSSGVRPAIKVTLTKNIPAASGLGGASSDAAAGLIGLNRFAKLGASPDKIFEIAAELGSDVPFFLGGPLALCKGRGEKIEELETKFSFDAALIMPKISSSTHEVYGSYTHNCHLYESLSRKINCFIVQKKFDLLSKMCANMLDKSCFDLHSQLAELKLRIETMDIGPFCLTGSGSAMYCMVADTDEDKERYQSMLNGVAGCESIMVHSNGW